MAMVLMTAKMHSRRWRRAGGVKIFKSHKPDQRSEVWRVFDALVFQMGFQMLVLHHSVTVHLLLGFMFELRPP